MVRIQLFSLFFYVPLNFCSHLMARKGIRVGFSRRGIRFWLLRSKFKLQNSLYFYLSWKTCTQYKRFSGDQCLTRWRASSTKHFSLNQSLKSLSLRFIQSQLSLVSMSSQSSLAVLSPKDEWRLNVAFVNHYLGNLNVRQLHYWRGGQGLQSAPFVHQLRFRFVNSRLTLLFTNPWTRADYFFVSAGIFTRYFFFQKSVKKSKALKLVMARFTRKMIIMLDLCNIILLVRGLPFMLENLISTLLSPLRHPFTSPLLGNVFDEVNTAGKSLSVSSLIFFNIKPFGLIKTRLRGRIKRKIRRRIYRLNRPDY